ncbi:uncharacterized protein BDR25DRAFT_360885 [Lindgomyces ingoldianus]|uniref:Uncharacterized protein n=1 Tax=Lindgomyces ingoldianus TaxID=673940 RepID=A0ACB6QDK3_9PLEO|nr:uncharacterized protein BDR25DRAFT_360885 [Lindgomyces ingoldianus]KAF2464981.1 hypothetical protein BDR25DRAFT_360885 [Lindgomyces ingoldianus]
MSAGSPEPAVLCNKAPPPLSRRWRRGEKFVLMIVWLPDPSLDDLLPADDTAWDQGVGQCSQWFSVSEDSFTLSSLMTSHVSCWVMSPIQLDQTHQSMTVASLNAKFPNYDQTAFVYSMRPGYILALTRSVLRMQELSFNKSLRVAILRIYHHGASFLHTTFIESPCCSVEKPQALANEPQPPLRLRKACERLFWQLMSGGIVYVQLPEALEVIVSIERKVRRGRTIQDPIAIPPSPISDLAEAPRRNPIAFPARHNLTEMQRIVTPFGCIKPMQLCVGHLFRFPAAASFRRADPSVSSFSPFQLRMTVQPREAPAPDAHRLFRSDALQWNTVNS